MSEAQRQVRHVEAGRQRPQHIMVGPDLLSDRGHVEFQVRCIPRRRRSLLAPPMNAARPGQRGGARGLGRSVATTATGIIAGRYRIHTLALNDAIDVSRKHWTSG
jgi:hypothetical protein